MKYIASCSFGKDSLATIILAKRHKEPLDMVVYCEVMFDKNISGEIPEHREFIYNVAIPKIESWGIKVHVVRSEKTFKDCFYHIIKRVQKPENYLNIGRYKGFPVVGHCYAQRDLKLQPIEKFYKEIRAKEEVINYIGIAYDEEKRLDRLKNLGENYISLLAKYKYTEDMATQLCKENGLLSPMYAFAKRGGCFFCPNAKIAELRHLYKYHSEIFDQMIALENEQRTVKSYFSSDPNKTYKRYKWRFQMEEAQLTLFSEEDY